HGGYWRGIILAMRMDLPATIRSHRRLRLLFCEAIWKWLCSMATKREKLDAILLNQGLILAKLQTLQETINTMPATLDQAISDVTAQTTVVGSAVTLLQSLSQQLKDAIAANQNGDPTKLAALDTALTANTKALADAVAANTPAAPGPSPNPTPGP